MRDQEEEGQYVGLAHISHKTCELYNPRSFPKAQEWSDSPRLYSGRTGKDSTGPKEQEKEGQYLDTAPISHQTCDFYNPKGSLKAQES